MSKKTYLSYQIGTIDSLCLFTEEKYYLQDRALMDLQQQMVSQDDWAVTEMCVDSPWNFDEADADKYGVRALQNRRTRGEKHALHKRQRAGRYNASESTVSPEARKEATFCKKASKRARIINMLAYGGADENDEMVLPDERIREIQETLARSRNTHPPASMGPVCGKLPEQSTRWMRLVQTRVGVRTRNLRFSTLCSIL